MAGLAGEGDGMSVPAVRPPWGWMEDEGAVWMGRPTSSVPREGLCVVPFPDPPGPLWRGVRIPPFWVVHRAGKRLPEPSSRPLHAVKIRFHPPRPAFERWVNEAREALARGAFTKVVVARAVEVHLSHPVAVEEAWGRLAREDLFPHEGRFFLALTPWEAFFGISPEVLFSLQGREVEVDLLAGTSTEVDRLDAPHLREEHARVGEGVQEAMGSLVEHLTLEPRPPLALGGLWHLRAVLRGRLRSGVTWETVLERLHPTPALGGHPTSRALAWIRETERGLRGWFGGVVGKFSPEAARFRVAIRSALLRGDRLILFAGGGVVQGHTPEELWEETARKMQRMWSLFLPGDPPV